MGKEVIFGLTFSLTGLSGAHTSLRDAQKLLAATIVKRVYISLPLTGYIFIDVFIISSSTYSHAKTVYSIYTCIQPGGGGVTQVYSTCKRPRSSGPRFISHCSFALFLHMYSPLKRWENY
jgi:hypothetical protein